MRAAFLPLLGAALTVSNELRSESAREIAMINQVQMDSKPEVTAEKGVFDFRADGGRVRKDLNFEL